MVARLSSKNFKKLIFLVYLVSRHNSAYPSGMAYHKMKKTFRAEKKRALPLAQSATYHHLNAWQRIPPYSGYPLPVASGASLLKTGPLLNNSPLTKGVAQLLLQLPRLQTIRLTDVSA